MNDLLTHLEALEAENNGAVAEPGHFLEPGTYDARIVDVEFRWDQTKGATLVYTFEDVHSGGRVRKFQMLRTAKNVEWFNSDMQTLGLTLKASELARNAKPLIGLGCVIQVKKRGEFTDVYINEKRADLNVAPTDAPEEEIPF